MSYPNQDQMDFSYPFAEQANGSSTFNQPYYNQPQPTVKVESIVEQPQVQQQHQVGMPDLQDVNGANPDGFATAYQPIYQPNQVAPNYVHNAAYQRGPAGVPAANATHGLPVGRQDDRFWNKRATLMLGDGQEVKGTYAELYRYPEAQKAIWDHYETWKANRPPGFRQPQPQRGPPGHQMARVTAASHALNEAIGTTTTAPKKTTRKAATSGIMNPPPAYAPDPDLDSPQSCRDYLAYVDPNEVHHLQFVNDDWQDVLENKKHEFIGRIFEALAHPHSHNPPAGIQLTTEAREKYHKQQDAQIVRVLALMQSVSQLKATKALCSLLFDAAVYVHQVGIPKEIFQSWQWYARKERQVERKYRLDLDSICSVRLEKLIEAVKANKLVAMDVLEQNNFHRMARDPDFYLLEKFTYLRSNKTRQENIDRHNKQDAEAARFGDFMGEGRNQAPAKGRKRKRANHDEEDMELDDDNGGNVGGRGMW